MTITRDRLTSLLGSLRYQATHDELTALGNRTLFTDKIAEALAEHGAGGRRRGRRPRPLPRRQRQLRARRWVTGCCGRSASGSTGPAGGRTWSRAWAATSSASCCRQAAASPRRSTVVERLRAALHPPIDVDGRLLQVRATFGVAIAGDGPPGRGRAGQGRGRRPRGGARRRTRGASRRLGHHPRRRLRTGDARAHAGPHGAVRGARRGGRPGRAQLLYQPIVDLATQAVHGVEALARWNHPIRGLVPPTVFVPLAEATGSIVPIGRWVLREAARSWPAGARSSPTATR